MRLSTALASSFTATLLALATTPAMAAAPVCAVEIEANDAMQFNKNAIEVSKTCKQFTVTLKHVGKLPKAAMGHNWVLSKSADAQAVAADGIAAGLDKQYVKAGDSRVIGHTKVLGPGETGQVVVPVGKLQAADSYTFFCSFPGHAAIMKGSLKLVN